MPTVQKYDIPVNFTVYAESEVEAERLVLKYVDKMIREFDLGTEITDHELLVFVSEDSCDGCGNNDPS